MLAARRCRANVEVRVLSWCFRDRHCIARLRAGPAGGHLDGFASYLLERGYKPDTGQVYVEGAVHFMRVVARRGVLPGRLGEDHLEAFQRHVTRCACRERPSGGLTLGAQRFLDYLRDEGVAQARRVPQEPLLIARFCEWMQRHRGSAEGTLRGYRLVLHAFLKHAGDDARTYEARGLRAFVAEYGPGRGKLVPQALRQFLRFLIVEGLCRVGLDQAIPAMAQWRLSSLPRSLPAKEIERIIDAASACSRDRAMLLLMFRLGLRNGDLRELRLCDVDWERGRLRVFGKSRREALLPLPQDAGEALLAYIQTERPQVQSDRVFFARTAPLRPLGRDTARGMVRSVISRAGVKDPPSRGCHLLRHSAATEMLRTGMTLVDIGVILRHRFVETTEIYAKVDLATLREIAQPWPRKTS